MPDETPKPLFSEEQVSDLVEARMRAWTAEQKLADEPPKTVTVVRTKVLEKLHEVETDVLKKHGEAMQAWKKAVKLYTGHLQKNPGSKAVNDPGPKPELGPHIENIRAWIRAFECLADPTDAPDGHIRVSSERWVQIFKDASMAIADMRAKREAYVATVSGLAISPMTFK